MVARGEPQAAATASRSRSPTAAPWASTSAPKPSRSSAQMPTRVMPPANARREPVLGDRRARAGGRAARAPSPRVTTAARGRPGGRRPRATARRPPVRASAATIRAQRITPSGRTMRASMRWVSGSPRSSRTQRSRTSGRSSVWTKSVNGRGSTRRSPRSEELAQRGVGREHAPVERHDGHADRRVLDHGEPQVGRARAGGHARRCGGTRAGRL